MSLQSNSSNDSQSELTGSFSPSSDVTAPKKMEIGEHIEGKGVFLGLITPQKQHRPELIIEAEPHLLFAKPHDEKLLGIFPHKWSAEGAVKHADRKSPGYDNHAWCYDPEQMLFQSLPRDEKYGPLEQEYDGQFIIGTEEMVSRLQRLQKDGTLSEKFAAAKDGLYITSSHDVVDAYRPELDERRRTISQDFETGARYALPTADPDIRYNLRLFRLEKASPEEIKMYEDISAPGDHHLTGDNEYLGLRGQGDEVLSTRGDQRQPLTF